MVPRGSIVGHPLIRDQFTTKKLTQVIANIWYVSYFHELIHIFNEVDPGRAMLRDESIYPNASEFIPERFLQDVSLEMKRKMDPRSYVFGFGRR